MHYLRNSRSKRRAVEEMENRVNERRHPDDFRIQILLNSIAQNKFKYYVYGGFLRGRGLRMGPHKVARLYNIDLAQCLFEIKDQRIEDAVKLHGLQIITPNMGAVNSRNNNDAETPVQKFRLSMWG